MFSEMLLGNFSKLQGALSGLQKVHKTRLKPFE